MRYLFFDSHGKLRSGWRVSVFLAAFIFVAAILGILTYKGLEAANIDASGNSSAAFIVNSLVSLISALVLGWLCAKYLEDLPFYSLGVSFSKGWHRHLIVGVALGTVTLGIAVLAAFIGGGLAFDLNSASTPGQIVRSMAVSLLIFGAAAAFEEVLFRGYILQTFARSGLAWLAILLTAVFFGIVHMGNPNSGFISSINTMLAGVWFGIAFLKTRDLWFVWGLHLMWNWTQGSVFGIEVSGITGVTDSPLLREIDRGPVWLTGLEYGIEGGVACSLAIIVSGLLIYKLPGLTSDPELLRMTSSDNKSPQYLP